MPEILPVRSVVLFNPTSTQVQQEFEVAKADEVKRQRGIVKALEQEVDTQRGVIRHLEKKVQEIIAHSHRLSSLYNSHSSQKVLCTLHFCKMAQV